MLNCVSTPLPDIITLPQAVESCSATSDDHYDADDSASDDCGDNAQVHSGSNSLVSIVYDLNRILFPKVSSRVVI
jgi:hypothetical protein